MKSKKKNKGNRFVYNDADVQSFVIIKKENVDKYEEEEIKNKNTKEKQKHRQSHLDLK